METKVKLTPYPNPPLKKGRAKGGVIIPALLEKNFSDLKKQIKIIEKFSRFAQIDVADGKFVLSKTFLDLKKLQILKTKLKFEIHLMAENPKKFFPALLKNKKIYRIIIHRESFSREVDLLEAISLIHFAKKEVFLAENPDTPLKSILPWLQQVDGILFLAVYPGFQGRPFQKKVLKKISALRQKNKSVIIAVDGGLTDKTIPLARRAGANIFGVGSFIVKNDNPKKAYQILNKTT